MLASFIDSTKTVGLLKTSGNGQHEKSKKIA